MRTLNRLSLLGLLATIPVVQSGRPSDIHEGHATAHFAGDDERDHCKKCDDGAKYTASLITRPRKPSAHCLIPGDAAHANVIPPFPY